MPVSARLGWSRFAQLGARGLVLVAVLGVVVPVPAMATPAPNAAGAAPRASEILAPSNAASSPEAMLLGVDCVRAGSCAAVGFYNDAALREEPMAAVESGGRWHRGVELRLPPGVTGNPLAVLSSVSCTAVGSCLAVGYFTSGANELGFAATQSHGAWARARLLTPPANSASPPDFQLNGVACPRTGSCAAVGWYADRSNAVHAMAITESGGRWRAGRELSMPASAPASARLNAIACPGVGSCTAVGTYSESSGLVLAAAVTESGGRWRRGTQIVAPPGSGANPDAVPSSVSCPGARTCVAVGTAGSRPMVASESGGRWARAVRVTAVPSGAASNPEPFLYSVACQKPGTCVAVGFYTTATGGVGAMTVSPSHGRWTRTGKVLPPRSSATGPAMHVVPRSVSCTPTSYCVLAGNYESVTQSFQGMAAKIPGS